MPTETHPGPRGNAPTRSQRTQGAAAVLVACAGLAGLAAAQTQETILQVFEMENDDIERRTADIFMNYYGSLWVPPPSRAADPFSVGFDCFDRFDLGSPPLITNSNSRTRTAYGTESTFRAMVDELHRAGLLVYIDTVLNHNSGRTTSNAFFQDGGWPGFYVPPENNRDKLPTDNWGDFHGGVSGGYLQSENPGAVRYDLFRGDLVALVDIDQTTNLQFIRQPVASGNPQNIPAGNVRNRPNPANARYYPDTSLTPRVVVNPQGPDFDGNGQPDPFTFYPWSNTDSQQPVEGITDPADFTGDPVAENGTGYLMRWLRWMLEVQNVDGFRLDASKHTYDFFWRQYFDAAVHLGRTTPDGRRVTPFSFGENTTSNQDILARFFRKDTFANRDSLDLDGAGALRELVNGGGFGSWGNVLTRHLDFADNGIQDGSAGVFHVYSHDNGTLGDGGSRPPLPTNRQQGWFANAYAILRPGQTIVYHNARAVVRGSGFFPREGISVALGWDPLTQTANDVITTLNKIRRTHGYGLWFLLNNNTADTLVFERAGPNNSFGNLLVGASDRYDAGFDEVTVDTSFAQGERLFELTGNARRTDVGASGDIFDSVVVGANGLVTIRVPRNSSSSGEHNRGFVAYGPAVPAADLRILGATGSIAPDPTTVADGLQRLTEIEVITTDTFDIGLLTAPADPLVTTVDDNAVFRIDDGSRDWNGNNAVDIPLTTNVIGGYEQFVTLRQPGMTTGNLRGSYRQTIDATQLEDGYHYISALAFLQRPANTTPLFNDVRKVIYVDRHGPDVSLIGRNGSDDAPRPEFRIGADRTARFVYVFLNLPTATDPIPLATGSGNLARIYDREEWRVTFQTDLQPGLNTIDVVAVEESGRATAYEFTVQFGEPPCPADFNGDTSAGDIFDLFDFLAALDNGLDFNGDTSPADIFDLFDFLAVLDQGCP